jgi:hypothetical protein
LTRRIVLITLAVSTLAAAAAPNLSRLPLQFQSSASGGGRFESHGRGRLLQISPTGSTLTIGRRGDKVASVAMQLIHANPTAHPVGHGVRAGQVNYLTGSDRSLWRTGLPTYDRVTYEHLYAGIDLIYYGREGEVEYDFRVAAGADPGAIRMRYSGADAICIDAAGDLVLTTAAGEIRHRRPVIYQDWDGRRREIGGRYRLRGREVAFEIGAYDRRHELVIDPIVTYGSYIGGSDTDVGYGIGADSAGNIYVGGETLSRDLPLKTSYQDAYRGNWDLFVTKIDPKGTVVYTTYLGGGGTEWFGGFAVDPAGNVVLSG